MRVRSFFLDVSTGTATIENDDSANSPPTADAGPNQNNVVCNDGAGGASVTLDGSGSSDPDQSTASLTFTWKEGASTIASGINPTVTLSEGAAHTITLEVEDNGALTDTDTVVITVVDNVDPVITLIGASALTLECGIDSYTELGATATDACVGSVSVSTSGTVSTSTPDTYTVTYMADDGNGNTATKDRTIEVEDTTDPMITCTDETLFADAMCQVIYEGPGAAATDQCDGSPVVSSVPGLPQTFTGVGDNIITYTATDGSGNTDACTQTVSVEDVTAPTITLVAGPIELWPPNHKYCTIGLGDIVTDAADNCDDVTADDVVTTLASSDEPENAQGDGNTVNDIVIDGDCRSVDLRAERQGGSNGRVYTLNLGVSDASDNVGTAAFEVHVPHSKKSGAVDDGPSYSEPGCTPVPVARMVSETQAIATEQVEQLKEATGETPTVRQAPGEAEGLEGTAEQTPEAFMLHGNRPNPFNPQTTIRFDVAESAYVKLVVYDMLGRQVRVLVDGTREAGTHEITFEAGTLPSGTYLYRLDTPLGSFTGSMLLLK